MTTVSGENFLGKTNSSIRSIGMVTLYHPEKGYGFIWSEINDESYFFHIKDYKGEKEPERGDLVSFRPTHFTPRWEAKDLRLFKIGRTRNKRNPAHVGVPVWTGPGQSHEYGLLSHKNQKGDGTFLHKSCLVDGSDEVKQGVLYKIDVAKGKDKYLALNAREIKETETSLIARLAKDKNEDPAVRLTALCYSISEARQEEFKEEVRRALQKIKKPVSNQPAFRKIKSRVKLPFDLLDYEFELDLLPDESPEKVVRETVIKPALELAGIAVGVFAVGFLIAELFDR